MIQQAALNLGESLTFVTDTWICLTHGLEDIKPLSFEQGLKFHITDNFYEWTYWPKSW